MTFGTIALILPRGRLRHILLWEENDMLRFFRVKRKHSSVGTDRSQSQRELIQKDAEIDTAYVICAESCTSGNVIHAHMLNEQSRLVYFSLK